MPDIFAQHPDLVELDRQHTAAKLAPMATLMAAMDDMAAAAQDKTRPFYWVRLGAELRYAGATEALNGFIAALRDGGKGAVPAMLEQRRPQLRPGMSDLARRAMPYKLEGFDMAAELILDMLAAELASRQADQ